MECVSSQIGVQAAKEFALISYVLIEITRLKKKVSQFIYLFIYFVFVHVGTCVHGEFVEVRIL